MRIGIVGGAENNSTRARYEQFARAQGGGVEFHDGHLDGRGPAQLRSLVERCDLVVIVTRINSHGAVRLARDHARKLGRDPLIVRQFGFSRFEQIMRGGSAAAIAPLSHASAG